MPEKALNIAVDESAAGGMLAGLRCGRAAILVHGDHLSCGPLQPLQSPEQWRKMREVFWSRHAAIPPEQQPLSADRYLLGGLDRLLAADVVTVWLGAGLSDQLFSIWFVQLAELVGFDLTRLRVVDVGRDPAAGGGHLSVGALEPEAIAAYPPGQPLPASTIGEMKAAWSALAAPDPTPLLALLATGLHERRELDRALRCLLARFPDARTGLTRWEDELLRSVLAHGPRGDLIMEDLHARAGDDPDQPYLYELVGRLYRMAAPRSRQPAVTIAPRAAHPCEIRLAPDGAEIIDPPFDAEVRITPVGEQVLAGNKQMVELNGIDDWVGGIHLDASAGRVWYRSGDSLRPYRAG
jgi:hypothetical protein